MDAKNTGRPCFTPISDVRNERKMAYPKTTTNRRRELITIRQLRAS